MKDRILPFFYRCLALLWIISLSTKIDASELIKLQILNKNKAKIDLYCEIADTPQKRSLGLMYRKNIHPKLGMLFIFPKAQNLSFWMKNTLIPLDIAFINSNGIIMQLERMTPLDQNVTRSHQKASYALEVNAGFFQKYGIVPGSKVVGIPK